MNELDVFGVEKTVLTETTHETGRSDVAATLIRCTQLGCTGTTCLCAVPAE